HVRYYDFFAVLARIALFALSLHDALPIFALVCLQVQIASISRRPNALRIVMPAQRISFLSLVGVASLAGLVLASCSTQAGGDGDEASTTVVATTTQIGSLVDQITECAGGEAQVLMSPGDDPHTFEASSTQIADMITADLVVTNGLGLEASMQR